MQVKSSPFLAGPVVDISHSDCATAPEVVIMDATSLSFRKDLDVW